MLRQGWTLVTALDPAHVRLRLAATTVAVLALTVLGVLGLVRLWDQPVVPAMLGVVVAMVSSLAVNDPGARERAVTTALLVPGAAVSVTLATVTHGRMLLSDALFVAVMVVAVYLRRWGPRGLAVGMVSFVAYFMTLFLQAPPAAIPVMVVSAAVGAILSVLVRHLLRPRHPGRDLRRELAAWSVRARRLLDVLAETAGEGPGAGRARRRLPDRVLACSEIATTAESRLEDADERLWPALSNEELSVRVFDVQLALERVVARSLDVVENPATGTAARERRAALPGALARLGTRLGTTCPDGAGSGTGGPIDPVLLAALDRCAEAWQRVWLPVPGDEPVTRAADATSVEDRSPAGDGDADAAEDEPEDGRGSAPSPWAGLSRTALQVAVAAVLAIVLGEVLSPSRWFWAVIAAFVVFTGSSTREDVLVKGWRRVVGTLFGVGAGVVVASLVGGSTVASVVLIVVCIFCGVYLVRISIAWMMFFITAMLGLLYGLLGQFSVGLLLVRLEETVAGAVAGVLAAYLVLPTRGRHSAIEDLGDVLDALSELLDTVSTTLVGRTSDGSRTDPLEQARALRGAMTTARATAAPLTGRFAGLTGRTGLRHLVVVVGACEHHARALARAVAGATALGSAVTGDPRVTAAVAAVARTVDVVRPVFDADGGHPATDPPSADEELEALRRFCEDLDGRERTLLWSVLRHLRAVDGALRGLTRDLSTPAPSAARPAGASHP